MRPSAFDAELAYRWFLAVQIQKTWQEGDNDAADQERRERGVRESE